MSRHEADPPEDDFVNDGILDPAQTLDPTDVTADPLDDGVTVPDRWSRVERYGNTAQEQRDGETLDQHLSEEVPDPALEDLDGPWGGEPEREAGRLVDPDRSDGELLAGEQDAGSDGGPEETAVYVTDEDADRDAVQDDSQEETLEEAERAVAEDEARDAAQWRDGRDGRGRRDG